MRKQPRHHRLCHAQKQQFIKYLYLLDDLERWKKVHSSKRKIKYFITEYSDLDIDIENLIISIKSKFGNWNHKELRGNAKLE